jgi:hypothetical protein
MKPPSREVADRQWRVVERWQEFQGEGRVNVLRIAGVGAFYLVHLLHYYQVGRGWLEFGDAAAGARAFHVGVTALCVAWAMMALAVQLCLQHRVLPTGLKYIATCGDLLLLTAILYLGGGPRSPLVAAYFLILAAAALRLSLRLVRAATAGGLIGYLCLLGVARWPETFGRGAAELRVPRYEQLIVLLALALTGVTLGQIVRRVRRLAEHFAERLAASEKTRV